MSVVIWRDGLLVADGQALTGGSWTREGVKLQHNDRGVAGFTGRWTDGAVLAEWLLDSPRVGIPQFRQYRGNDDPPEATVLFYDRELKRLEFWTEYLIPEPLDIERFFAVGSGQSFAIGAMEAGADAVEATAICCRVALGCGFPLWIFDTNRWELTVTGPDGSTRQRTRRQFDEMMVSEGSH